MLPARRNKNCCEHVEMHSNSTPKDSTELQRTPDKLKCLYTSTKNDLDLQVPAPFTIDLAHYFPAKKIMRTRKNVQPIVNVCFLRNSVGDFCMHWTKTRTISNTGLRLWPRIQALDKVVQLPLLHQTNIATWHNCGHHQRFQI